MAVAQAPSERNRQDTGPLRRYPDRGLIGGVCAGLAAHLGVDVRLVRALTAMVAIVGGLGLALYALAWALIPVAPESDGAARRPGAWREAVLIVLALLGVSVALRVSGVHFADSLAWPLVLGACGMALVWRPIAGARGRGVGGDGQASRERSRRAGAVDAPRLVIGALLVAFASAGLLHVVGVLHRDSLGNAIGAVAIIATVLGLLIVPWFVRLGRNLSSERAARIREQERARMAAHLHDSVLQTLALIQTRAEDPREVAGLARRQERELRRWLLGEPAAGRRTTAWRARWRVRRGRGRGAAPRADRGRHGRRRTARRAPGGARGGRARGADQRRQVRRQRARGPLRRECGPTRVEVFVRDRGVGFDPEAIPPDRHGVRDSIIGRMERHGGRATVRSAPGQGTEIELRDGARAAGA